VDPGLRRDDAHSLLKKRLVMPAKAGIHSQPWIPAFAGMTVSLLKKRPVMPAKADIHFQPWIQTFAGMTRSGFLIHSGTTGFSLWFKVPCGKMRPRTGKKDTP
jgi:hypothetical protein